MTDEYFDFDKWRIEQGWDEPNARNEIESEQVAHRYVQISFPLCDWNKYKPNSLDNLEVGVLSYLALEWRRPMSDGSVVIVHRLLERLNGEEDDELPPVMLTISDGYEGEMEEKMSIFLGPVEESDVTAMLVCAGGPELLTAAGIKP